MGSIELSFGGSGNLLAGTAMRALVAAAVVFVLALPAAGQTTLPSALLNSNGLGDSGDDYSPHVVNDGSGIWLAVWSSADSLSGTIDTDFDILVARSSDGPSTWTSPIALNSNAGVDTGDDTRPRIATDGAGTWVAVWDSTDSLGGTIGTDSDILFARSVDAGATWSAPAPLNSNAAGVDAADTQPHLVTDGMGNWLAGWQMREPAPLGAFGLVMVARSSDGGATWTAAAPVNSSVAGLLRYDEPAFATDGAGNWVAVWEANLLVGGSDVVVSTSSDAGASWTLASILGTGGALPEIAADGLGNWIAVWVSFELFALGSIAKATSVDAGSTWSPQAPLFGTGIRQNVPVIAADGMGSWAATWTSIDHNTVAVAAFSTDVGASWTLPASLTAGGVPIPVAAGAEAGEFLMVFSALKSPDRDIYYTRRTPTPVPSMGTGALVLLVAVLLLCAGWVARHARLALH